MFDFPLYGEAIKAEALEHNSEFDEAIPLINAGSPYVRVVVRRTKDQRTLMVIIVPVVHSTKDANEYDIEACDPVVLTVPVRDRRADPISTVRRSLSYHADVPVRFFYQGRDGLEEG